MKSISIGIIGGGPGGLMTAHLLQQRSDQPLAVTIFEASERLGGKVATGRFQSANVPYEIGAAELYDYTQLGPDPLRELVTALGLTVRPMKGETVVMDGHILRTYGDIRRAYGDETVQALKKFNRQARNAISPGEYYESDWKSDNADPLSRYSFRAVLNKIEDANARRYVEVAVHSDVAAEPHQTNASYGLQNWLMNEPGYMKLYSVDGGNQRITDELVRRIAARKLLKHRVVEVRGTPERKYEIVSRNPEGVRTDTFDFIAVALPNNWLPAIRWGDEVLSHAMERHHAHYDHPAHYLRVSVLFRTPFWRHAIDESYFMVDGFGGACVYDESSRGADHSYGVLGWLLGGEAAATQCNRTDRELTDAVLATLPPELGDACGQYLETRVHRWIGSVNALPGSRPIRDPELRHVPEPVENPNLFTVGDYLFDSTLNGVLDSAEWVADSILESVKGAASLPALANRSESASSALISP